MKKHPILVLAGMVLTAVLVLGQLADSIPGVARLFSGVTSLMPRRPVPQELAYADPTSIQLKRHEADARLLASLPPSETVVQLAWSADGHQLAALIAAQPPEDEWPSLTDRRIWYTDLVRNEEGAWPCPSCGPIAFAGNQVLTLSDHDDRLRLRVFSLDALPASPDFSGKDWGPEQQRETIASTLGGGPDGLLFVVADPAGTSAQGGPQLIYRADAAGRTHYLGKTGSNVGVGGGVTRANGREIVVVYTEHNTACDNVDHLAVINLANSSRREVPQPDRPEAWRISSVDWTPEGELVAVRYALSRAADNCGHIVVKPQVVRWDGQTWHNVEGSEGASAVVAGAYGALATLRPADQPGDDQPGFTLLVRYPDEEWNRVAEDVTQVAWRPNQQG